MPEVDTLLARVVYSFLIIALLVGSRHILLKILKKEDIQFYNKWKILTRYIVVFFMAFFLVPLWLPSLSNIATALGIFGAGLFIGFKEILLSYAGWLFLILRRPFSIGDRIQVGEFMGDVIDIGFTTFSMIEVHPRDKGGQSTGRIVSFPNNVLFTQRVINATGELPVNWYEIHIGLSPKVSIDRVKKYIQKAMDRLPKISPEDKNLLQAREKYGIYYRYMEPQIYAMFEGEKLWMIVRFLEYPKKIRFTTSAFWEEVQKELKKHKIEVLDGRFL